MEKGEKNRATAQPASAKNTGNMDGLPSLPAFLHSLSPLSKCLEQARGFRAGAISLSARSCSARLSISPTLRALYYSGER